MNGSAPALLSKKKTLVLNGNTVIGYCKLNEGGVMSLFRTVVWRAVLMQSR
jgi:hypothetical protein